MKTATFEGFIASLKKLQHNFPKIRGGGSKARQGSSSESDSIRVVSWTLRIVNRETAMLFTNGVKTSLICFCISYVHIGKRAFVGNTSQVSLRWSRYFEGV